jgi:hypothetical protein
VFIWDASSGEIKEDHAKKRLPKGSRLVTAIGFSAKSDFIAAADAAEKVTVHVFKVAGGIDPICDVAINQKIVHLGWSPVNDDVFATCGKDHIAFCTVKGKSCTSKMGSAKGGKVVS